VRLGVDAEGEAFRAGLGQIGQVVIGAGVDLGELVERRVDIGIEATRQPVVQHLGEAALPEAVLDARRRLRQPARQFGQRVGVGGLAGAGNKSVAAHGGRVARTE